MGDYCPDADGLAAAAGIRTGDILKGIHLPNYHEDDKKVDFVVSSSILLILFLVEVVIYLHLCGTCSIKYGRIGYFKERERSTCQQKI